jgi:hypothetical protein
MKNYIIWSPERGLPTKTHAGLDAATAEASRLAAKHPSVPFHVYELLGTACASVSVDYLPATAEAPAPAPKKPNPDEVAKGHNPLGLTNAEVGVSEGWRLLAPEEINPNRKRETVERGSIQYWWEGEGWNGAAHWAGNDEDSTYRTKNPPGFYLPKVAEYVPEGLPAGSSAGKGFRFLRPDEVLRETDEINARSNFPTGNDGWLPARTVEDIAVLDAPPTLVYRRKLNA